jgi:hypothetical protein
MVSWVELLGNVSDNASTNIHKEMILVEESVRNREIHRDETLKVIPRFFFKVCER